MKEMIMENWVLWLQVLGVVAFCVIVGYKYAKERGIKELMMLAYDLAHKVEAHFIGDTKPHSYVKLNKFIEWYELELIEMNPVLRFIIKQIIGSSKIYTMLDDVIAQINAITHSNRKKASEKSIEEFVNSKNMLSRERENSIKEKKRLREELFLKGTAITKEISLKVAENVVGKALKEEFYGDNNLIANDKLKKILEEETEDIEKGYSSAIASVLGVKND